MHPLAFAPQSLLNQHWTSDVIAGAGLGTVSALLVVHLNESHSDSWLEQHLLPR